MTVTALGASGFVLLGSYAARMHFEARSLRGRVHRTQRRESDVLEAVRVLTAAARSSTQAVLEALDAAMRVIDPNVDDVLVFAPADEELACVYAGGLRSEHFAGSRLRLDRPDLLPALAVQAGHRAQSSARTTPLIPTDRAALAVPMLDNRKVVAVVYAASARTERFADPDSLVRAVAQAASPYALAAEREADRASATYDGLTGLLTPRAFRNRLHEEIARARLIAGSTLSLWFVDTDNFKQINDTFGHGTGDVVLQAMGALLRAHAVAGIDVVARNGGDEFCAIVRNTQKTAAIERAAAFCRAVRAARFDVAVSITASIGVASYPYDATSASELLEKADAAMYHSKTAGRDCVSFAANGEGYSVYR